MQFDKQYFLDGIKYRDNHIREGQYIFTEVYRVFPKEVDSIIDSKYDCFNDDTRIEAFLEIVNQLVSKEEDITIVLSSSTYIPIKEFAFVEVVWKDPIEFPKEGIKVVLPNTPFID